jgi:ABC-type transport system involved in multi-copper enzyme maturation permease subunit
MINNPVFFREIRKGMGLGRLSFHMKRETNWEVGNGWWIACVICQYILTCLIAPIAAANAITQEKEQQTWEMLCFTNLRAGEIILGKLLARFIMVYLMISLLLPCTVFCWIHATLYNTSAAAYLSVGRFVMTQLVILISTLFYTTFGLFMSWTMRRTIYSIMMSYTFVIGFLLIGTTLITLMLSLALSDNNLMYSCPLVWLNPILMMTFAVSPDTTPNATQFLIYGLLSYILLTMLMLWRMIVGFRHVVVEA